jgi:hypothetical protein
MKPKAKAMTESEWLTCEEASAMLSFASKPPRWSPVPGWWFGTNCGRKMRLFAAACVRRFWPVLEGADKAVVLASERYADGLERDGELIHGLHAAWSARTALDAALEAAGDAWRAAADPIMQSAHEATACSLNRVLEASRAAASVADRTAIVAAQSAASHALGAVEESARADLEREQAALLRDIVGPLPFRPLTIAPHLLAWYDGTVPKLAQGIYDDRAFDRLPILADALEEAGCVDDALLSHLRGPGPHVRGCWALDLILGKE